MRRIVISSPRSGLNWLRFVVEDRLGLRTPGKTVLIDEKDQPEVAFLRSHDPLWRTKKPKGLFRRDPGVAFLRFDPEDTADDAVVLILRDFREVFVRACRKMYWKFAYYIGNLEFYVNSPSQRKAVFYYEDLIRNPEEMARLLDVLDLRHTDGSPVTAAHLAEHWEDMANRSRGIYDKNQRWYGGAMTKKNPLDFSFHQKRALSDRERAELERYTREALPPEALKLIERYL